MQTTIVNVKVAYIRSDYDNLQEWINDEDNEYIGRAGIVFINKKRYPPQNSEWHNPFKISKDMTRDQCLRKYKKYLIEKLKDNECLERFKKLRGKNLGCWCKPEKCHGDIIIKLLDDMERNI